MRQPSRTKTAIDRAPVVLLLVLILSRSSVDLYAQGNPGPDVLTFSNGEKLIGHLESVSGGSAKFKSDSLGEITVDLSKIQELHTPERFAAIRKDLKLSKAEMKSQVPQGSISIADQKVEVTPEGGQPAQTVAVADLNTIVDQASFDRAFQHSGILEGWKGGFTFGSSIVESTQNSLSFSTSANVVRVVPAQDWLAPRHRTILDFTDSYGKVTQPGSPTLKTSIYHADAEQDEYLTARVYALGGAAFDHSFSQGLDLQQTYGGGIGWTVLLTPNENLDLKATINYERQAFLAAAQNQNLANSIFQESYNVKLAYSILLKEQLSASPAWTNMRAYSTYASLGIILPVHKRFGFNVNIIDSFLNNPPPGFKKNSIQFMTGLSYTLP